MLQLLLLFLLIVGAMWAVYTYVNAPFKWIIEVILGVLLIIICFRAAGVSLNGGL